jgi:hypothetical protein
MSHNLDGIRPGNLRKHDHPIRLDMRIDQPHCARHLERKSHSPPSPAQYTPRHSACYTPQSIPCSFLPTTPPRIHISASDHPSMHCEYTLYTSDQQGRDTGNTSYHSGPCISNRTPLQTQYRIHSSRRSWVRRDRCRHRSLYWLIRGTLYSVHHNARCISCSRLPTN